MNQKAYCRFYWVQYEPRSIYLFIQNTYWLSDLDIFQPALFLVLFVVYLLLSINIVENFQFYCFMWNFWHGYYILHNSMGFHFIPSFEFMPRLHKTAIRTENNVVYFLCKLSVWRLGFLFWDWDMPRLEPKPKKKIELLFYSIGIVIAITISIQIFQVKEVICVVAIFYYH